MKSVISVLILLALCAFTLNTFRTSQELKDYGALDMLSEELIINGLLDRGRSRLRAGGYV